MARLDLKDVSKSYGNVEVMRDINLSIGDGEFIVLVGPSGCGKSTLLRMIAGLEPITDGEFSIDGQRMNELRPRDRDIAMVFQSYALYPHMTVGRNMGFSKEIARAPKEERAREVAQAAQTLGLDRLIERYPRELSGGQRQRVAMGRAIIREPRAFLFDEPLSNLDASLRVEMRLEIARMHRKLNATMVYVTHDQVEALTLADRIVVLEAGRIQQVGSPLELYERPANKFVARFIGSPMMNVLPARPGAGGLRLPDGAVLDVAGDRSAGEAVEIGVRPEHIDVVAPEAGDMVVKAEMVEHLGSDTNIYVRTESERGIMVRAHGHLPVRPGAEMDLHFQRDKLHLFAADGTTIPRTGAP
ncbi:multiple sugar transport system ATP-binding protein/multiple sugar transport system ATP-binding protein [Paracoccus isoporae]|uniref:Multiple sugar transport system ATP-binding protein/multiple sugar transport system ATP-binding protein n=1 Tax=Paracoccus isoporae TaxID=591205 RepID=A0A1G7DN37_9RHOB|nr:sn-glycerol-3-phosphate ABC transporter ATP-binding protein UgpC [Paracoccus isoporae]SDE52964.1 multiple sugar transport system ATP-binding protein/multiple sugar transport system ATP-binding protein [Paracoccus isoporae]